MTLRRSCELILDIFFPPICLNCKKYLEDGERDKLVCASCLASIEIYSNLFYPFPGITLAAASSYSNPALKELIHYLKYKGFLKAGKALGEILTKYLNRLNLNPQDFIIVPVPLYGTRHRKRGFNQAELLAEIVGKHFNRPVLTKVLKRIKETKPQIEISDYKIRSENIKGVFSVAEKQKELVKGKQIILVDDVCTSGATIKEAARTLKRAGARKIIALVVAKTN